MSSQHKKKRTYSVIRLYWQDNKSILMRFDGFLNRRKANQTHLKFDSIRSALREHNLKLF